VPAVSIAFLDTETITLDAGPDVIWEIGIITRDIGRPDAEWLYQVAPNMKKADPKSLEIGGYHERYQMASTHESVLAWGPFNQNGKPARLTKTALAMSLHMLLADRSIFGICPSFDTLRLGLFLRRQLHNPPGYRDPWHYQPHDVEDEVAGFLSGRLYAAVQAGGPLGDPVDASAFDVPRPTEVLAEAIGLDPEKYAKHTAMGDCRLARDMHDAVSGSWG
jgi:hypothetical protein